MTGCFSLSLQGKLSSRSVNCQETICIAHFAQPLILKLLIPVW
ncbi:hypothetical protein XBJ1_1675 [Xenorhabdus bovienii SS-2004]|uniref:Uncharacterized protein n=1 Tax=Xenorhabdus bovienii (strain SS-2004) TaxID=406818 RepID=D3V0W9_XENBS|nr:hypothetical protein XBJ1_1675 [Xenorhabdus bovienii SS-2004]